MKNPENFTLVMIVATLIAFVLATSCLGTYVLFGGNI